MPDPRHIPPKQDRSRRTLERIETATLELIAEKGVEETTVQDIVKRARSSVGSFYARFPAKEDLLLHLEQKVWSRARDRFDEELEERDFEGVSLTGILERTSLEVSICSYLLPVRGPSGAKRACPSSKSSRPIRCPPRSMFAVARH